MQGVSILTTIVLVVGFGYVVSPLTPEQVHHQIKGNYNGRTYRVKNLNAFYGKNSRLRILTERPKKADHCHHGSLGLSKTTLLRTF